MLNEFCLLTQRIEAALDKAVPPEDSDPRGVAAAMRHALLGGGKRLRPALLLTVAEMLGENADQFVGAACAVEMAHTTSLILDDMPCMDNAQLRRGKPCTHKAFGSSTAILAAVALLTEAFEQLAITARRIGRPENAVDAVVLMNEALGIRGLAGGQYLDLMGANESATAESMMEIHARKAGALFVAAAVLPAVLLHLDTDKKEALHKYACSLGLAFQMADDLIDAENPGEDNSKSTAVRHWGVEQTREKITTLIDDAVTALTPFGGSAEKLRQLAYYVRKRSIR